MTTTNIFNYKKFKGNGSFASVLRNNQDEKKAICYSKTKEAAVKYLKGQSKEGSIQFFEVYNHTELADRGYREL